MSPVSISDESRAAIYAVAGSADSALMVFGSVARGDASPMSDVDVLELTRQSRRPTKAGKVHVYRYTADHLRRMAESGSLFVLHLRLEGEILRDDDGLLKRCLSSYKPPKTYALHRSRLKSTAMLMDAGRDAYSQLSNVYNDLAIYVLRTVLYIQFAESGRPTFSLTQIAKVLKSADLDRALTLKNSGKADFETFVLSARLAAHWLETSLRNPYGTVEALLTNEGPDNLPLMTFGLRLLGVPSPDVGYDLNFFPLG